MIRGRVLRGRVEVEETIPQSWEGQEVKIMPLTPDDSLPELDEWLKTLDAMGPMEYEPGERELIERELSALDERSRESVARMMGLKP